MPFLPVDTAVVVEVGPCIDDTDFKTLEAAIAYDASGMSVDLLKKSATSLVKVDLTLTTGAASDWTHKGNGVYELEITAAQNDTEGTLRVVGVCDGVLPFESPVYTVVPTAVYNSLITGSDKLQVDAVELGSSTQSATDLKDFADAGYDPGTNKVQGVVLTDTCTVNTDMVGTDSAALANVCTEARLAELDAGNLPADLDAVLADTNELQTDDIPTAIADVPTVAEFEARTVSSAAATKLEAAADTIVTGSASPGTLSTTQMSCDLSYTVDDALNGRLITWEGNVTAALTDVQSDITDHEGTDTPEVLTFTAIPVAPADGDNFVIT